jgi:OOP family OmpA-OmpF porin
MKKNILFSAIALSVIASTSYAGGDLTVPNYVPVVDPKPPVEIEVKTPIYIGVGLVRGRYSGQDCDNDLCSYEDVTYGAMLRAGYDFNEYFGLETRVLGTFWDVGPLGGQTLQHMGIYAKPMLSLSEESNIYALLGYGWTKSNNDEKLNTVDDDGFAAGLGFEYSLNTDNDQELGLFVDYQRLLIKSDVPDMDVISAGILFDF